MYLEQLQDIEAILYGLHQASNALRGTKISKLCFMAEISVWSTRLCGLMKHAVTMIIHSTRK